MTDLANTSIETARLLLTPISLEFAEEMFKEFSAEITHYMYPKPASSLSETRTYIKGAQKEIKNGTDLTMCITIKATGEYIGNAGVHNLDSKIPELGIWIKKSAHGNRYGREAMQGAKKWTDENLSYKYIRYPVAKDNVQSRKVAEALGGVVKKEYAKKMLTGKTWDMVEYQIPQKIVV